jgi:hypothetical protein
VGTIQLHAHGVFTALNHCFRTRVLGCISGLDQSRLGRLLTDVGVPGSAENIQSTVHLFLVVEILVAFDWQQLTVRGSPSTNHITPVGPAIRDDVVVLHRRYYHAAAASGIERTNRNAENIRGRNARVGSGLVLDEVGSRPASTQVL